METVEYKGRLYSYRSAGEKHKIQNLVVLEVELNGETKTCHVCEEMMGDKEYLWCLFNLVFGLVPVEKYKLDPDVLHPDKD